MTSRASVINAVLAAAAGRPVPPPENTFPSGSSGGVLRGSAARQPLTNNPSLTPERPETAVRRGPGTSSPFASGSKHIGSKPGGTTQIFSVRVPKWGRKNYSIMRFNGAHKIDFTKWKTVKMQREDNSKHYAPLNFGKEDMPKFGAGSEYGRDKREAAKRRKYGMYRKKYRPQDQPWVLRLGDHKANKKYKGMNEGGVNDNASYFVFTHTAEGTFDVFPIKQWINFKPVQTYKSLSAEEAEEEFSRRNKVLNLFTVMVRKRMKVEGEEVEDKEEKASKSRDSRAFKVSEMDDWVDDDDDDGGSDDSAGEGKAKAAKKKAAAKKTTKKKKKGSDEEPGEESDDGDEEGMEVDYISDSTDPSEDEDDKKPEMAGVDQEKSSGLLDSETSEEEEEEKKKDEEPEQQKPEGEKKDKKKKPKKKKEMKDSSTKDDSDSSEPDNSMPDLKGEEKKSDVPTLMMELAEPMPEKMVESMKRKAPVEVDLTNTPKKAKLDVSLSLLQLATSEGITEEVVRKYLLRKPMTVTELLQKLKPRKNKISNEDMVSIIAHILTNINPIKRTQGSKTYFSLKN